MKKRFIPHRPAALLLAAALLLSGCSAQTAGLLPAKSTNLLAGVTAQAADTATPAASDTRFTEAQATFALALFAKAYAAADGRDTLLAPLSISTALAMTANGASGETKAQMEQVLGGLPVAELNTHYARLKEALAGDSALHQANALWLRDEKDRLHINDSFLQALADHYDAGAYKAPFTEQTRKEINAFVRKHTNGQIDQLTDSIDENSLLYLVNALDFDAEWAEPYGEHGIQKAYFYPRNGNAHTTQVLCGTEHQYIEDGMATGFIKDYAGGKYAFVALLPNTAVTLDDYVQHLAADPAALLACIRRPEEATVITQMPLFSCDSQLELSGMLASMGMTDAFTDKADFSALGYSENGTITISRVLHRTHITVDANGTKAGAATAVELKDGAAMPGNPREVLLNRPFVYLIVQRATGLPVFIGTVMDTTRPGG